MRNGTACMALLLLLTLPSAPASGEQQRQENPPVSVQNIKGNIYQLKGGSGANTGFFVADKEVLVIDAKMTEESAKQMLSEIKKVTPNPVTRVVLTHSDGDHVNGLVGFPVATDVISHENTRVHMDAAFQSADQRSHLPGITFSERMSLFLSAGGKSTRVEFLYFGPAHTNGDVIVFFPEEKIAFIGDLLFLGRDPLIHRAKGGTSFGLVKVLDALLNLDVETYLIGHNEPSTKQQIRELKAGIEEKQSRIWAMVKDGKSLDEIKKAFNIASTPGGSRLPGLAEVIYQELTEKKAQ